jgi:phospholipid transport system substrate-binding protein
MWDRSSGPSWKRLVIVAIACGLGLGASFASAKAEAAETRFEILPASSDPPQAAARMVQDLGQQTANALASNTAKQPGQRRALLRELVKQGFDLELTSQFVLGKYWNRASTDQRAEFMDLFTEYLLNSYARHLAAFQADTLSVVASNPAGEKDILVETKVNGTDGQAAPVWRVRAVEGEYKIIDVTVDGVSLALTQRREFASVVNRVGLEGLLKMLRDKLEVQSNATTGLEDSRPSHASLLGSILASPNAGGLNIFVAGR